MSTIEHYSTTYGLPAGIVSTFLNLNPGEATRVINAIAGNHVATTKAELKKQWDIIQAEVNEALDNLNDDNLSGLRDDAMDIVFTGYGLANRLGAPADLDYRDVVLSNVCKFDTTEEDAVKTRDKYLAIGVVTTIHRSLYDGTSFLVTKVAYDQIGIDGKKYPGGKWLKSHKWVDCQYQGQVLSPLVTTEGRFELTNLNPLDRQSVHDLLINMATGYENAQVSEAVADELKLLVEKALSVATAP